MPHRPPKNRLAELYRSPEQRRILGLPLHTIGAHFGIMKDDFFRCAVCLRVIEPTDEYSHFEDASRILKGFYIFHSESCRGLFLKKVFPTSNLDEWDIWALKFFAPRGYLLDYKLKWHKRMNEFKGQRGK